MNGIIKEELTEIRNKYGDERRTQITHAAEDIELEDLIEDTDVVITLTHFGYIKRTAADVYKSQRRGGKGVTALTTREDDFVTDIYTTSTHHYMLFFTNRGKVYRLRVWEIPEASRQAKGTAIVNLLELILVKQCLQLLPLKGKKRTCIYSWLPEAVWLKRHLLADIKTYVKVV